MAFAYVYPGAKDTTATPPSSFKTSHLGTNSNIDTATWSLFCIAVLSIHLKAYQVSPAFPQILAAVLSACCTRTNCFKPCFDAPCFCTITGGPSPPMPGRLALDLGEGLDVLLQFLRGQLSWPWHQCRNHLPGKYLFCKPLRFTKYFVRGTREMIMKSKQKTKSFFLILLHYYQRR